MARAGCRRRWSTWASRWGIRARQRAKAPKQRLRSGQCLAGLATGAAGSEPRGVRYPMPATPDGCWTWRSLIVAGLIEADGRSCARPGHCHRTDGFDDHPVALAVGSAWPRRRRTTPPPCLSPVVIASGGCARKKPPWILPRSNADTLRPGLRPFRRPRPSLPAVAGGDCKRGLCEQRVGAVRQAQAWRGMARSSLKASAHQASYARLLAAGGGLLGAPAAGVPAIGHAARGVLEGRL